MKPAPVFNADSAYHFIEKQVAFGPRVPNTTAHKACGDFLIGQLETYGKWIARSGYGQKNKRSLHRRQDRNDE